MSEHQYHQLANSFLEVKFS